MRLIHVISTAALLAAVVLSGCLPANPSAHSTFNTVNVPSGTSVNVTLATLLTSETAQVGTAWSGSISNPSMLDGRNVIPVGSLATGTVTAVTPARQGDRAMLDLGLAFVTIDGRNYRVQGNTESVIAGSTRARNLGAIGAATVAAAVAGQAVAVRI